MSARLLLLGAGSGAANNLVRSLRAADCPNAIVGAHHDRFVLRTAPTERRYLLPPAAMAVATFILSSWHGFKHSLEQVRSPG